MAPPGARRAALVVVLAAGCGGEESTAPNACQPAEVLTSAVAANAFNVLSAIVTTTVVRADSVAVRYGTTALDSTTPAARARPDSIAFVLPVLGLLPAQEYAIQVVAYHQCGTTNGPVAKLITGQLPEDLPRYSAGGSDPSPGYVVLAAGLYGFVIDNTGRIVWYHRFRDGPGLNFQAQPNGRYAARPAPPSSSMPATWVEIDVLGNLTRELGCANGLTSRPHDMIAKPDGSYWVMCDEVRTLDLSATGGPTSARVTGTMVQYLSASGGLLFSWSPFDHFDIDFGAIEVRDRAGASINWTHGNAIDLDSEGNLLVSFRNLSEVTKIDVATGSVVWRLGGRMDQFGLRASERFARQHGVRATGAAGISMLDNLGDPSRSQARRYEYDATVRTSRVVVSYGPDVGVIAQLGGTTQELPGGRMLVSFGSGGRVEEYDANGRVVWGIEGDAGYLFRAQRIRSLYRPGVGLPR